MTGILDMTLEGLGEMFRGYSAETCAGKFPLVPMGVRAEGPASADPGSETPIGASGNFLYFIFSPQLHQTLFQSDSHGHVYHSIPQ